ncbi:molybdopterin molybdotransferase MoeA [Gemmata sp.]|uniref:molybdopterin molybdotransferase MoeA n=1 Tax=Gemmata sp. TaxID=1914242 RepID=UPI003F704B78
MLDVADALAEVLARVRPLPPTAARLAPDALGRVLAVDVRADADSPPFPKSLRDGYAVRSADCSLPGRELRVTSEIAAGVVPTKAVAPGECARIFTGAPMPEGADAVVMQEDTQPAGDAAVRVTDERVKPGQWVFARGTEMRAGDVVLAAGTALTPAALGVLAGLGLVEAKLFPAPRVFVLPTGNELVEPGRPLRPGQIRNSNGPMLAAQVVRAGGVATHRGIGPDTLPELLKLVGDELDGTDVLLVAGGVSVGKYDLVPAVLGELGVATHVRQVRMKPGKPLLFGSRGGTLVFGLPGNPVSAAVCFELFVRPALRVLAGHSVPGPTTVTLPLAEAVAEVNDRPTYRPAKLEVGPTGYAVRPLPWLGAPDLRGLAAADALLVLPAGEARLDPGSLAQVVLLN